MYNNPRSSIYIDGVLKSTKDGVGGNLNTGILDSLKIGNFLSSFAIANIDDMRIYNSALSSQEIQDIYILGGGLINPGVSISTPSTPNPNPVSSSTPSVSTSTPPVSINNIYNVKQDGTGSFTTIQACANVVKPGETCLVHTGIYDERINTISGGNGENSRIIFKTQGIVTVKGFNIKHPYVTVDGFDMTGRNAKWGYYIDVVGNGSYCKILHLS